MKTQSTLLLGVMCLVMAQVVAFLAWPQRPAQAQQELVANDENLGEVFVELEPGEFAGTLMLGGLRGLVIDLLWLRALGAKDEGRFYESVALFELISKVQPRFEQVWEYMAHDLSYNIAVEVQEDDRWAWYLAGADAINQGVRRNPRSVRLLRWHAWLFHHKGENYLEQIESYDWSTMVNQVLLRYPDVEPIAVAKLVGGRDQLIEIAPEVGSFALDDSVLVFHRERLVTRGVVTSVTGQRPVVQLEDVVDVPLEDLRLVASMSSFQLAYRLYHSALELGERQQSKVPSYVRRIMTLGVERDGNRLRNRGAHRAGLLRYLDALEDWQSTLAWTADPNNFHGDQAFGTTYRSYQRNEGRLRRRAGQLALQLAPDPIIGMVLDQSIKGREFVSARMLLMMPSWPAQAPGATGVRWYDEVINK